MLEFLDPFAELHDLVILVDLRAAVSGEGVLAHLPVHLRPPPERRALDSEPPRKVDGPHLAAEDHPRRRYLELLIVTLPLLVQDFRRSPKCRVLRYQVQVNSMPQEYPRFLS